MRYREWILHCNDKSVLKQNFTYARAICCTVCLRNRAFPFILTNCWSHQDGRRDAIEVVNQFATCRSFYETSRSVARLSMISYNGDSRIRTPDLICFGVRIVRALFWVIPISYSNTKSHCETLYLISSSTQTKSTNIYSWRSTWLWISYFSLLEFPRWRTLWVDRLS